MDWGNVAEWSAAIFTGVATLAAAYGIVTEALRRRREQAGRVAAWISWEEDYKTATNGAPVSYRFWDILHVKNNSDAPIYDVIALMEDSGNGHLLAVVRTNVLPPGEELSNACEAGEFGLLTGSLRIRVSEFVDGVGRRWRRQGTTGRLVQTRRKYHLAEAPPQSYVLDKEEATDVARSADGVWLIQVVRVGDREWFRITNGDGVVDRISAASLIRAMATADVAMAKELSPVVTEWDRRRRPRSSAATADWTDSPQDPPEHWSA